MELSIIKRIAKTTDCNHYSVMATRAASIVSLAAFAALSILWGNLGDISQAVKMGLGIGALGAVTLVCGFELLTNYWKRGEISRIQSNIKYADGSSYKGETLADKTRDGLGTFIFHNGMKWVGEFKNNLFVNGKATRTFPNGHEWSGMFNNGVCTDGTLSLPEKVSYQGKVTERGLPYGQGTVTFPNQDQFIGQFKGDITTIGKAILHFPNGTPYEIYGPLAQQAYNNRIAQPKTKTERLQYQDGSIYEGQCHQGIPLGPGTLRLSNGQRIDGVFDEGNLPSHGTWTHPNQDYISYSGPLVEGALGLFKKADGSLVEERLYFS